MKLTKPVAVVKVRNIAIPIKKYPDGRFWFSYRTVEGKIKKTPRVTLEKAKQAAGKVAFLLSNNRDDISDLSPSDIAEFRAWKAVRDNSPTFSEVLAEYWKWMRSGNQSYRDELEREYRKLGESVGASRRFAMIPESDLTEYIHRQPGGERRKANLRAMIVTLWRFARQRGYIKESEADKMPRFKKRSGQIRVLEPSEMRLLLKSVLPEFLPWLAIAAFSTIRSEEIAPLNKRGKHGLQWEDIKWDRKIIDVSADASKTGSSKGRRIAPMPKNLLAWLAPYRKNTGLIAEYNPLSREKRRLGLLLTDGKWPHNCLRDSGLSYRAAIIKNVAQLAYEAGNSPRMIMQSYHEARDERQAKEYFNIFPTKMHTGRHRKVQ